MRTTDERRAAITFPAPHGTEVMVLADGDEVAFGRDASCAVRFGYAPTADAAVPRVAGRFIVAGGRVFVECGGGEGRRSMEVGVEGSPPVQLALGEAYSPSAASFVVTVHGDETGWQLAVDVRARSEQPQQLTDEVPTRQFALDLTPRQREVLAAYAEPLRRGLLEPATHREAAESLGCHPNSARTALYEIWARMFAAGIPIPDLSDKRVAVTEAARLHRLLDGTPSGG